MAATLDDEVVELRRANAELQQRLVEALAREAATAEVMEVINSSQGGLAPVFGAILEKALNLCEAAFGLMRTWDGERFIRVAERGSPELVRANPEAVMPIPGSIAERFVHGEKVVSIANLAEFGAIGQSAGVFALMEHGGARSYVGCTLKKDGHLLGLIALYRQEIRPFTDKQIALLQNFAAQAVIGIENARLITETREALERQTATAELLGVINASSGDLAPVFDAMLDKAMHLCEASGGALRSYDGNAFHAAAMRGVPREFAEQTREVRPHPTTALGRIEHGESVIHIADLTDPSDPRFNAPTRRQLLEAGGFRTALWVALRKETELLGTFVLYRNEVRPFTDKQIELVESFAAQAVIAIENARLLDEIRQRQQELRVTFDNMADGVAMFDVALHLAAWNRNFQELLDLPDEFFTEPQTYDGFIRYLGERGEYGDLDPQVEIARLRAEFGDHFHFERTRPDGTVLEVRHNPMPDGGFVLIYSDITERKRSEAEIRAARDTAEATLHDLRAAQANLIQAEKMASLGQLTAGIAHEIKNPLNFVNNFASLSVELLDELKETTAPALATLDADKRADVDDTMELLIGNLEKIAEHGKRADNIVKSMLEHSRGVSGERREVDLNQLVEEALNLAYHGARAQDQTFNITLERNYAESLKPIEVAPQEITRVFLNLFGNGFYAANKRSHENGEGLFRPTLTVATRDDMGAVEVRVRDNGTGIPAEIKDKLFQPFFTTKPTGEGTGLGLSISYDIVTQQHGGTITVDSRVGEFTEFTVRLPRR